MVRRHPERGVYDVETIHAILDEDFLCHVGFVQGGQPIYLSNWRGSVKAGARAAGGTLSPRVG